MDKESNCSENGSPFHSEKARFFHVEIQAKGKGASIFYGAKEATTYGAQDRTAKLTKVGKGKGQQTLTDYGSNPEYDMLLHKTHRQIKSIFGPSPPAQTTRVSEHHKGAKGIVTQMH